MSDNKFLTSAQPKVMNPKENIKMTPDERSEGRKGLKTAVATGIGMFPYGRALKGAGKVAGAFINTAKQYMRGGKAAKKTSNFRPLVTGNRVYDRKMINDAFKSRFGSPAKPKDIMGRPQAIPANPKNVIKQATQGKDALTHLKKVKKMASNAGPKNSFKGLSSQSSTSRTNFRSSRDRNPLNFKGANSKNSNCWPGYKKVGTKKSPSGTGETVNDCKKM